MVAQVVLCMMMKIGHNRIKINCKYLLVAMRIFAKANRKTFLKIAVYFLHPNIRISCNPEILQHPVTFYERHLSQLWYP